jgi:hypothetical protein
MVTPGMSIGISKRNFREWTVSDPLIEGGSRPRAVGAVSSVEVFDEFRKHSATLDWVGDDRGDRW